MGVKAFGLIENSVEFIFDFSKSQILTWETKYFMTNACPLIESINRIV